ncbi:outer membrane beta-barrel protein [Arcticibacter eurypsychrophilus]|uniref:outer membrane beta-barrel protein n=1 Tax=Arcticibacter eurypsychrophilus TaxID=1434752 RepID=UPI00084D4C47|nr:outer membrane beta-barrel protein [Arcticibacter eurypsychrophilus]
MRKIILLAAVTLIGGAAIAQSTSPTKFGLKVGIALPKYHFTNTDGDDYETEANTNFNVTGYADLPIASGFSVQPGISLQGKGSKTTGSAFGVNGVSKDNSLYVEIPVNLVGKVPLGVTGASLYLGAGPYAAFAVSGERKLTVESGGSSSESTSDLNFGNGDNDDFKSGDFGVNILGGIQLNSGFNFGANYGIGLSDIRPGNNNDNGKITNRVLSFNVGYSF